MYAILLKENKILRDEVNRLRKLHNIPEIKLAEDIVAEEAIHDIIPDDINVVTTMDVATDVVREVVVEAIPEVLPKKPFKRLYLRKPFKSIRRKQFQKLNQTQRLKVKRNTNALSAVFDTNQIVLTAKIMYCGE